MVGGSWKCELWTGHVDDFMYVGRNAHINVLYVYIHALNNMSWVCLKQKQLRLPP